MDDFTIVNMLDVSPTVGDSNSVDIYPERGENFTLKNIQIPKTVRKFEDKENLVTLV